MENAYSEAIGIEAAHCVNARILRAVTYGLSAETVTSGSIHSTEPVNIERTESIGQVVMCSTCVKPRTVISEGGVVTGPLPTNKILGKCFRAMLESGEVAKASTPRTVE